MLKGSNFNQDIGDWNTKNVEEMNETFSWSKFNRDISRWNTRRLREFHDIFRNCAYKQNLDNFGWNRPGLDFRRGMSDPLPVSYKWIEYK